MLMKRQLRLADDRTRRIWLADSFAGLPPPENRDDGWDLSSNGYLAVSAEQVRRNFERFGLWDERVCLLEGWFKDTLPRAPVERLAILRLDGDLYHSTRDILENLYPRVSPGGFIIVDDYGSWPGCRRAVTEYLTKIGESPEITPIDDTGVFWRRPV
jgi:O-methyltransferase